MISNDPGANRVMPADLGIGRLFDAVRDAVIAADATTGTIVLWNPAAEAIFGYSADEAMGRSLEMLVPPDLRQQHRAGLARFNQTGHGTIIGARTPVELPALHKSGDVIQIELTLTPIDDAPLPGRFALAIIRDVTERKRAELALRDAEVLRQSEELFRIMADAAPVLLWISGLDKLCTHFNRGWLAFTGRTLEQELGHGWAENVHPDDLPRCWETYARAFDARQEFRMEYRLRRHDGEYRWVLDVGIPRQGPNETFLGYVGSAIDVTPRKEFEASLHFLRVASVELASSLDYRQTLKRLARVTVPVLADWSAVDILQEDGTIERLAGAHLDPANEQFVFERHRRFPPSLDAAHGVGKVLRTGEPEFIPEVTADVLAGAATSPEHLDLLRTLGMRSMIIVPLVARGRVLGSLQVVLERADRHYSTDDLWLVQQLTSQAALEVDNARLFEGEARARQEAEAAIRLRDEFLGVAAHELRTPLAVLRGFTQLLARHFTGGGEIDSEKRRRYLQAIGEQTEKLNRLIGQLLDVSQIEQGRLVMIKQRTNVAALVREVVANVQEVTETQTLVARSADDVWVEIDPLRIEQVLINLLANAIRYSPEQGSIEVDLDQPDPETIRLTVRDHGLGISPERRARIFNLFYQAHQDSYRSGLGLGLYISREIVQSHGGDIHAEFPPDGGARFIVTLPAALAGNLDEINPP